MLSEWAGNQPDGYWLHDHGHPAPLQDVRRALRLVRARSKEVGIDENRIGIIGFSAGWNLASMACTLFTSDEGKIRRLSRFLVGASRLGVAIYPVITMDGILAHVGGDALLSVQADQGMCLAASAEGHVSEITPPAVIKAVDIRDPSSPVGSPWAFGR
ncbi:alpha/beta hydrolase fold domain-containing protein [Oleiharenicola lentus]|uniref:alpha/beta hydrolase fold domain-containing protein n=1 Tax=Oleiharenicola lentus TaxID=2508720 RepID=UPI003F66B044